MKSACASGTAAALLTVVPFDVGHSTLPSALDLDPSTLRSALVALSLSLSLSYVQKTAGPKAFLMSRLSLLEYS